MSEVSDDLVAAIEAAIASREAWREGSEIRFRCALPDHADEHPSARWNPEKRTWYCDMCKKGGGWLNLGRLLGVIEPTGSKKKQRGRVVAEYRYVDDSAKLRYVVQRTDTKEFLQWRPDGHGGRIYQLGDIERLPYDLPTLLSADPLAPVFLTEGEKDVEACRSRGLVASCNSEGAGKWRVELNRWFEGRQIVILADNDDPGRAHAEKVARNLHGIAASVKVLELPGLAEKGDVSDFFATGGRASNLLELAASVPEWTPPREGLSSSSSYCGDAPPPFPTDVFPPEIQAYIDQGAAAFGVPADMIAVPLFGFAAAAIGRTLAVELKPGWREYPVLWVAVIGKPGTGKSPALDYARGLLDRLQDAAWKRYEEELKIWNRAEKEAKQGRLTVGESCERPTLESFFTTDATTEALGQMAQQAPGLAVIRDELIGWVKSHDAYRAGGDRQTHLSLWAGAPLKVDRKTALPLYVPRPCISVVGGIQPDRLTDLRAEAGQDDGFIDRVLLAWPEAAPAKWTEAGVPQATIEAAEALFARLRHFPGQLGTPRVRPPTVATLEPEALATFVAWHDENADSVHAASGLAAGCAAKYPRQVARIAAVLHALWNPDDPGRPVDAETMHGAIAIIEYFRAHACRVLPMFGATGTTRAAGVVVRVERILKRAGGAWVARTDLHRGLGRSVAADELTAALEQLAADGRVETRSVPTSGRSREEWRACQHQPKGDMNYEESPFTGGSGPRAAPFLHNSYRDTDDAEGRQPATGSNGHEPDGHEPAPELLAMAPNILALSPDELMAYRAEVAAAPPGDPDAEMDRAALALAESGCPT